MTATGRGDARRFIELAAAHQSDACLIWPYGQNQGYGAIQYPGIRGRAPRVVCTLVYGPAPTDRRYDVAHSCGNKLCVAPRHLRWATRKENEADKVSHGRTSRGSNQGRSKLTEADIRAIRAEQVRSTSDMAAYYGVHRHHINFIRARKTWKWLED